MPSSNHVMIRVPLFLVGCLFFQGNLEAKNGPKGTTGLPRKHTKYNLL